MGPWSARRVAFVIVAAGVALGAAAGLGGWFYERPSVAHVGVTANSDEQRLMIAASRVVSREREKIRIKVTQYSDADASAAALNSGEVDFAVARTDQNMPRSGQTAIILSRSATVIIAPAGSDIKTVADLRGKRVGVLNSGDGQPQSNAITERILAHYGATSAARTNVNLVSLRDDFTEHRIDALFVIGVVNATGGVVADAVRIVASLGEDAPSFIPVKESAALAQLNPFLETITLPRGSFGGSPLLPTEDYETIGVSTRLLARSSAPDSLVGDLTRVMFANRPAIAEIEPLARRMSAPATDKGNALPVHSGAAAYLDGEEETFFERYSDAFYIGAMLASVLASSAAALLTRLDGSRRDRVEASIEKLLQHLSRARCARTTAELDALEFDADEILADALHREQAKALDSHRATALGLAMDQLRLAIRDQRQVLQSSQSNVAAFEPRRLMPGE